MKTILSSLWPAASQAPSHARSQMLTYDQMLVWVTLLLLMLGMVMVYSASISLHDSPKYIGYTSNYFLLRQAIFIGIGIVAGFIAFQVKMEIWQKYAPYLFALTLVLLVIVLVPGLGKGVNGAKRWLSLKVLNIQPSEIMKMVVVLMRQLPGCARRLLKQRAQRWQQNAWTKPHSRTPRDP